MPVITLRSHTIVGRYVDAEVQGNGLNEETEAALRRIEAVYVEFDRERHAIEHSRELTQEGQLARLDTLRAKTYEQLKVFDATIATLDSRIADERAAALGGAKREPDVISEMRHRELRDVVRARCVRHDDRGAPVVDHLQTDAAYLEAIIEGRSDLVAALEPPEFNLISDSARQRGDQLKVERSPQFATIQELQLVRDVWERTVGSARREIDGQS